MGADGAATAGVASSRLDRRVLTEAAGLCKAAARALKVATKLTAAQRADLERDLAGLKQAISKRDLPAVRRLLAPVDAAVDKVAAQTARSPLFEYAESIGVALAIALLLRGFVVEAFKIPSASMIPTMQIGDFIFVNKVLYGVKVPYTDTKLFDVRGPRPGEVIVFDQPCKHEDFIKRVVATAGDTVEVRCNQLFINGKLVPEQAVPGPCSFWDVDGGSWELKDCKSYRSTLGDYTFTLHHRADGTSSSGEFPINESEIPVCRPGRPDPRTVGKIVRTAPDPALTGNECAPRLHYVVPAGHVFAMGDNRDDSNDSRFWGPVPVANIKGKAMFIWLSLGPKHGTDPSVSGLNWLGMRFERVGNFVH
ncbi:MAG: signal peptidase I [Kofleriaceae bacterium]